MTEVATFFKQPKREKRRRAWNSTLPAAKPTRRRSKPQDRSQGSDMASLRRQVWARSGGRCEAEGLHHPDCPGVLPVNDWAAHHVWPRQHGGPDELGNLIAVWAPNGIDACHHRIHSNPARATELGLLSRGR